MTEVTVHPCPLCELRFVSRNELAHHVALDHAPAVHDDIPAPRHARGVITLSLDPSRPTPASLPVATALARQADLAVEPLAAATTGESLDRYLAARRAEIRAAGAMTTPGREVALPVAEGILAHLERTLPALACLSPRAWPSPLTHTLGSVSTRVVRSSPVPIVLVGPHIRHPGTPIERLLVGYDGSPLSHHALEVAAAIAECLGVGLGVVEVVTPKKGGGGPEPTGLQEAVATMATPPRSYLAVHDDDPVRTLVGHAGDRGDTLLVVGTHGHREQERAVLGSVAFGLARHAAVPVVVVRRDAVLRLHPEPSIDGADA